MVQHGVSPSEYLDHMTPIAVGRFIEVKRPKYVNGIHEDALYRLHERREELIAKGVKVA